MTDAVPAGVPRDEPRDEPRDARREAPDRPACDTAETLRRAIRAVARADRLVGKARAAGARRDAQRAEWIAAREARAAARTSHDATEDGAADAARQALRTATACYVRERRAAGDRPERMLVALKGELRATLTDGQPADDRTRLAEAVVRWGIAAYYATDPAA